MSDAPKSAVDRVLECFADGSEVSIDDAAKGAAVSYSVAAKACRMWLQHGEIVRVMDGDAWKQGYYQAGAPAPSAKPAKPRIAKAPKRRKVSAAE